MQESDHAEVNFRTALQGALELASGGDLKSAVSNLEAALDAASAQRDKTWARLLLVNLVILEERPGQDGDARRRCVQFLNDFGDDHRVAYALARIAARRGEIEESRAWLNRAHDIASTNGDAEWLEVITHVAASVN